MEERMRAPLGDESIGRSAEKKMGFAHILNEHGEQIEKKGFANLQKFLDYVTQHVDAV